MKDQVWARERVERGMDGGTEGSIRGKSMDGGRRRTARTTEDEKRGTHSSHKSSTRCHSLQGISLQTTPSHLSLQQPQFDAN
jgi:hypothetical protein